MRQGTFHAGLAGLVVFGLVALSSNAAHAEVIKYKVELNGANEVEPPTDSAGTGVGEVSYDTETRTLTWNITYSGLSGPATAAHFHGPAGPGIMGKPVVTLSGDLASPLNGSAVLPFAITAWKDWYFNIYTEKWPRGEIRGQVLKVK